MSSFILRTGVGAVAPSRARRVAVKDVIDVAGTITTAGCRAVAASATPAAEDARCLAGIRAAEAAGDVVLVGKTNLHELAFGPTGVNGWSGTPVNPVDRTLVPGGSSSGSATAVGSGDADVALGTDTAGSVRIPAACCGVVGLKTTWGRISTVGVWPLAPSLDVVGPMARDVAGIVEGMALLEPGFRPAPEGRVRRVGRVRLPAHPRVDLAVDASLAAAFEVVDVDLPGWQAADTAANVVMIAEAWAANEALFRAHGATLGTDVAERLLTGSHVSPDALAAARAQRRRWQAALDAALATVDLLALPTLAMPPPRLAEVPGAVPIRYTSPINLAGVPALSLPVPTPGRWPASVQLVGPLGGDEVVVSGARDLEASTR